MINNNVDFFRNISGIEAFNSTDSTDAIIYILDISNRVADYTTQKFQEFTHILLDGQHLEDDSMYKILENMLKYNQSNTFTFLLSKEKY